MIQKTGFSPFGSQVVVETVDTYAGVSRARDGHQRSVECALRLRVESGARNTRVQCPFGGSQACPVADGSEPPPAPRATGPHR